MLRLTMSFPLSGRTVGTREVIVLGAYAAFGAALAVIDLIGGPQ